MEKKKQATKKSLELFQSGMIYAANLKRHWAPNECDGSDAMKQHIRQTAKKLKQLP